MNGSKKMKRPSVLLAIVLSSNLLVGCGMDLPFVGNVQEKIIPLLDTVENAAAPIKGFIRPLRERFFPHKKRQSRSETSLPPDPARAAVEATSEDPTLNRSTPTPEPRNPEQKKIDTNMTFDHWRSIGIKRLYDGDTLDAIRNFKKALAIKPNDANIQDWIFLAENPGAHKKKETTNNNLPDIPAALPTSTNF